MGWTIFSFVVVGFIVYRVSQAKLTSLGQAAGYVLGFVAASTGFLFVAFYLIPLVLNYAPDVARENYGPIVVEFTGIPQEVADRLPSYASDDNEVDIQDLLATPTSEPLIQSSRTIGETHTVKAGETLNGIASIYGVAIDELIALNNLENPNRLEVGQTIVIKELVEAVVQETAVPQPTTTPAPDVSPLIRQLNQAKLDGNIALGESLVNSILAVEPGNLQASSVQDEILQAMHTMSLWESSLDYGMGQTAELTGLLAGQSFLVVDMENGFLTTTKWEERVTLEVTSMGWLKGQRVVVWAGHLDSYRPRVGQTIEVQ